MDPWGDIPRWSDDDGASPSDGPADAGLPAQGAADTPGDSAAASNISDTIPRTCPWCATPAADEATRCSSCGAALAQRESIGDLMIPGLTAVDPALKDLDGRPLHLAGPSPSHGVASGAIVAAAAGGPLGLAILGGFGAVAAVEYLGASRRGPGEKGHDSVGETSEAVLQAVERLERGEALTTESEAPDAAAGDPDADAQSAPHDDGTQEASDGVR
jgi:hypothetical protein